jgi:hypothetical protein
MAEKRESNFNGTRRPQRGNTPRMGATPPPISNSNALSVRIDVDCSEALKGLKAVTRAAKKATAALKELEEQKKMFGKLSEIPITIDGKEIVRKLYLNNE